MIYIYIIYTNILTMTILSNMWKKNFPIPWMIHNHNPLQDQGLMAGCLLEAEADSLSFFRDIRAEGFQQTAKWGFPKIGVPQNGRFIMEHPIKVDDLGVPLFSETSESYSTWMIFCSICSIIPEHDDPTASSGFKENSGKSSHSNQPCTSAYKGCFFILFRF